MARILLLVSLLISLGFSLQKKHPITIYMAGDSTMAYKPKKEHPERGWGMLLPEFFDDKIIIKNHARNGRSTRTFIEEGRWQAIIDSIQKGDYVVIQFGHNDGSITHTDRYTPPDQYKTNLIRFVNESRAKKAQPILCTPIMRRRFDKEGKFYDVHGVYPDLVRQVADSLRVPIIDMQRKSEKVIIAHGLEGSKKLFLHIQPGAYEVLPEGLRDDTHFSEYGARIMTEIFAEGLKETKLKLAKHLKDK
ncbi:MAG: rhamnogalacturonan acetylesterase [Saprospiraceae bacterium]|nr:rhamnogalacturonan acetylesterase [Saprospiraceae bacterium]